MDNVADLTVYDDQGNLTLVVEVKGKVGTDSQWAARFRRNLLAHGSLPQARYFLLALPDRFYLWTNQVSGEFAKPSYDIDPEPFLKPYLEKAGIEANDLSREGMELLVVSWLNDLLHVEVLPEPRTQSDQWLIESGLFDAIKDGHILTEFA